MDPGQNPETFLHGELILCTIFAVQVAPVADDVAVQEFCGRLFTALQCIQGTWSRDDCPETESRCSDDNLLCQRETLTELVIARFCENRHRNSGSKALFVLP